MIAPNMAIKLGLQPAVGYAPNNPGALSPSTTATTTQTPTLGVVANPTVIPGGKTQGATSPPVLGGTVQPEPVMTPQYAANDSVPATGLIGSEQAILGGFTGAMGSLDQGNTNASNILNASSNAIAGTANPAVTLGAGSIDPLTQASGNFTGYMDAGTAAAKLQADLSGANGVDAEQAAVQAQGVSPATQYLMDQAIKGRERSAAARGGLFSGNTGLELNKDLAGILSQNSQQNFNNLGTIAGQGLNAAGQVAGLNSTQAGLAGNIQSQGIANDSALLQQKNSIQANIADRLAEITNGTSQNKALLYAQTGQQLGAGRTAAGNAIAQNVTNTANSISQALKEQGIGVSASMAEDVTTVANLLHEAGMQDAVDSKTLAQILANISTGTATNLQQGYQNVGDAQAAGIMGTNAAVQNGIQTAIQLGAAK